MKKVLFFLAIASLVFLSSCATQGYGCKGKESWNHMVRRINR